MKRLLNKNAVLVILVIAIMLLLQIPVLASNENTTIVKTSDDEYLIYEQEFINENFKFAYAKDKDIEETELNFINALQDNDKNYVAYVDNEIYDSYFLGSNTVYMWIENSNNIISNAIEINLDKAITQEELDAVANTTKRIKVALDEENPVVENVDGVEYTTTIGSLKITPEDGYTYEYAIVRKDDNAIIADFIGMSEEIAKIKDNFNSYVNIKKLDEFYTLYNSLIPEENAWMDVEDYTVTQPEDSSEGEKYVVWLRATDAEGKQTVDVQFMTCSRVKNPEYVPEVIEQKTTVKLPVTFDTTITLLIILGVIILAIIALLIAKKQLNKNDKK